MLDNVLVDYGNTDQRFTKVQLADFGGTVPADSQYAKVIQSEHQSGEALKYCSAYPGEQQQTFGRLAQW